MLNALFAPDWDTMDAHARQSHIGQVFIGEWPHPFPLRDDTDRVFIDLLADSPTADWTWFHDTRSGLAPTHEALQERVAAILATRTRPPVTSTSQVDWPALDVRIRATAGLIIIPSYRHPNERDAFLLSTAIFGSMPPPRRPRRTLPVPAAFVPLILDPPQV